MRCPTGWSGDAAHVPAAWDAWELTGRISPRRVVRAATVDADGRPVNAYPLLHPISGAPPATPWAVHLANAEGRFRLLCADLDAKTSADAAARDADRFSGLLTELHLPHLVCASGPTGGRHVWIGLAGELTDRLQASSHDAFVPAGGLGLEAGSLYGRTGEPLGTVNGARLMGWTVDKTTLLLERLASAGLIVRSNSFWIQTDPEHLDRLAVEQGTNGRNQQRADRYAAERATWAWWQAELVTMRASRLARSQIWWVRVVDPVSVAWPPHPRRRGGRADFAAARRAVALGRQPGTMGRRELVRGGFHSVGQQCAPSQRLPKVTSLPPRNTRQNRTSALLARVTRLG